MNNEHIKIGKIGEREAARYLRRLGCRILARNRHQGKNELDLIVRDGNFIAFVEVKTRAYDSPDAVTLRPSQAVDGDKRTRTRDAALAYLRENPTTLCPRLDVVEVYLDRSNRLKPFKINHIPGAFTPSGAPR